MQDRIITADLTAAAAVPGSRISEAAAALGINGGRHKQGIRHKEFTVEDAIRILAVKRLQAVGLALGKAANAVKEISFEKLKQIIIDEEQGQEHWLVVGDDVLEVANAERVVEIAKRRGGVRDLRIVNVTQCARDVVEAQAERVAAEAERAAGTLVTAYTAGQGETGIQLHGSLRLAIFHDGHGLAFQLTPATARDLARHLLKVADQAEAPARPEDVN